MRDESETEFKTEQIELIRRLLKVSKEQTQLSAERTYMNAERTLSVWVRTALALMVFGIAMDRFGLLLRRVPGIQQHIGHFNPNLLSTWGGAALVSFGIIIAVTTGVRFAIYVAAYRRNHEVPVRHGPFLGPFFALCTALFGLGLLLLLLLFTE
ncbi:MAG: YidH family protein [Gammaproteobacteria bacterium]